MSRRVKDTSAHQKMIREAIQQTENAMTDCKETDAWEQFEALVHRFTKEIKVRPDLRVEGLAWDRTVKLTLVETDYTKDRLDARRERHHTTQRNVSTMQELAAAIFAACDFVEHCNPAWAERCADRYQSAHRGRLMTADYVSDLRAAAAGRKEYAESNTTDRMELLCQAEAFDAAADLIEGKVSRRDFETAFVPSWRWGDEGSSGGEES